MKPIFTSQAAFVALFLFWPFFIRHSLAQSGNCLDLDGSNDYVSLNLLADDMAGSSNFSIEFWVKGLQSQPSANGQAALFGVHTSDGGNVLIFFIGAAQIIGGQGDGKLYVFDGISGYQSAGPYIGDNEWHQVIYSRNGSLANLVVDGVPALSHIPFYNFSADNLWSIGQDWDGNSPTDFFDGQIDGLKIYNGATLISDYGFDHGTAGGNNSGLTTLTDAGSGGNNGDLINFALNGSTSNWVASSIPLPVELLDFQVKPNGNTALLSWRTTSEQDNKGFFVERLLAGNLDGGWCEISFVPGAGTSTREHRYSFTDHISPLAACYRLRQTDFDGNASYSRMVCLEQRAVPAIGIYPNPVADLLRFTGLSDGPCSLRIINAQGRVVLEWVNNAGLTDNTLDVSSLDVGLYWLCIRSDSGEQDLKFVKK